MSRQQAEQYCQRGKDQADMNQLDPALTSLGMAIQADPEYAEE